MNNWVRDRRSYNLTVKLYVQGSDSGRERGREGEWGGGTGPWAMPPTGRQNVDLVYTYRLVCLILMTCTQMRAYVNTEIKKPSTKNLKTLKNAEHVTFVKTFVNVE